jgi:hypothetical protein
MSITTADKVAALYAARNTVRYLPQGISVGKAFNKAYAAAADELDDIAYSGRPNLDPHRELWDTLDYILSKDQPRRELERQISMVASETGRNGWN